MSCDDGDGKRTEVCELLVRVFRVRDEDNSFIETIALSGEFFVAFAPVRVHYVQWFVRLFVEVVM